MIQQNGVCECLCFDDFMAEQRKRLQKELAENRWYLSERAGYDVGEDVAFADYVMHHLDRFAKDFRTYFCLGRCPRRPECGLAADVHRLASVREMLEARFRV